MALTQQEIDDTLAGIERHAKKMAALKPTRDRIRALNSRHAQHVKGDYTLERRRAAWQRELLTIEEAAKTAKRSKGTIRRWLSEGRLLDVRRPGGVVMTNKLSVLLALNDADSRSKGSLFEDRHVSAAGPGRPRNVEGRDQVQSLLSVDSSLSVRELARRVGVSRSVADSARSEWLKNRCDTPS